MQLSEAILRYSWPDRGMGVRHALSPEEAYEPEGANPHDAICGRDPSFEPSRWDIRGDDPEVPKLIRHGQVCIGCATKLGKLDGGEAIAQAVVERKADLKRYRAEREARNAFDGRVARMIEDARRRDVNARRKR